MEPAVDYSYLPYATSYGYNLPAPHVVPFGSSSGLDPLTQGLDAVTQGVVAPYAHHYGKRSAEAEPQYLAYGGLGYSGYAGYHSYPYTGLAYSAYPHPLSGCRNYVGAPVPC